MHRVTPVLPPAALRGASHAPLALDTLLSHGPFPSRTRFFVRRPPPRCCWDDAPLPLPLSRSRLRRRSRAEGGAAAAAANGAALLETLNLRMRAFHLPFSLQNLIV